MSKGGSEASWSEIPSVRCSITLCHPYSMDSGECEIARGIALPAGLCEQGRQAFRRRGCAGDFGGEA
jgi:hypothetical protein